MNKLIVLLLVLLASAQAKAQTLNPSFDFFFGGMWHAPRTDYVSDFGGLDVGFSGSFESGHALMFDLGLNFGRARDDFRATHGWIYNGDLLTNIQLYVDYGRVVRQTFHQQLMPFVGLGCTGYQYNTADEHDDDIYKSGISTRIGFCYDWLFSHPGNGRHNGLRIKPYGAISFYGSPLKFVPSFNLSVCYLIGE